VILAFSIGSGSDRRPPSASAVRRTLARLAPPFAAEAASRAPGSRVGGLASSRPQILIRSAILAAWVGVLAVVGAGAWAEPLQRHKSRHYEVLTDLPREEAATYARHMDVVFDVYEKKFADFRIQRDDRMPLYLFADQAGYEAFLDERGIDGRNSGGIFFVSPRDQGLAVFVRGRARHETLSTLQHEGFHQFAWRYIGPKLPVWANEGVAQYFEDGLLVDEQLVLGHGDPSRLALVRSAIERDQAVPFEELLGLTPEQWSRTLARNPSRAALYYAQSWSIVDLLVNSGDDRLRRAFELYLKRISLDDDHERAYRTAFRTDRLDGFEKAWRRHVAKRRPNPLVLAVERMEFLARGLMFLHERERPMPGSLNQLREQLQRIGFYTVRSMHGISRKIEAADDDNFRFVNRRRMRAYFQLLEPADRRTPPRILAPGLNPEPTLQWRLTPDGKLTYVFHYR